jgi:hypothetical protein
MPCLFVVSRRHTFIRFVVLESPREAIRISKDGRAPSFIFIQHKESCSVHGGKNTQDISVLC